MSFFEDASLVLIPSGIKNQKIYSVKPTDGTGDLTFSRASSATRVASNGLIEKVRTNLILQSNTFNTTWASGGPGATVTSGQADPDGGTSAWLLSKLGQTGRIEQNIAMAANEQTFSIVAKKGTSNFLNAVVFDGTSGHSVFFNLDTGSVGTQSLAVGSIVSLGSGWFRCSVTSTNASATGTIQVYISDNDGSVTGTSGNIYIYQSQFENGVPTDYIATTTAAVSVGPVSGLPRLDYLNSSCPRLLLEPQRSNSVTYSEQLNNAAWNKLNTTISANAAAAPDGTTSADLVYPTTTGTDRLIEEVIVATTGQTWTSSFFVKASGFSWVLVYSPNLGTCWFNASTGSFGSIAAGVTATVLGQVNGFWRVSFTGTIASGNSYFYAGPADANGTNTATTSGTNGLLFWGCQLEQGAYATSYIPTLGTSVTRVADVASKTGISSLIGQTEGTLFCEFFYNEQNNTPNGNDKSVMRVESGGGYANEIAILYYGNEGGAFGKTIQVAINNGGVAQSAMSSPQTMVSGYVKVALAYKANDFALAVNGVVVATDNSGSVPTCANFSLNESTRIQSDINPKQALLFKTRLTNAQLAELTA
jgi:hypothetical protein